MSAISNMSRMTQFSTLSIDTQLSVQTNLDAVYGSNQWTPSSFETFPFGENIDPRELMNVLMNLWRYIANEVEVSRLKNKITSFSGSFQSFACSQFTSRSSEESNQFLWA